MDPMACESQDSGLIGGVEKREISIVEYDPEWPAKFARHAGKIADALGETAVSVEHIGSTSVPGLAAKPIIDILVTVPDSADETAYAPQLEVAGYKLRVREPDWNEHRMFRNAEKDVHIHVYSHGCAEIGRNIAFRNFLRANASERYRYENTKRELARHDWPDMNAYARAKTAIIEELLAKAALVLE
jgi:GrpB-like predicted nucleotidyltransferase (UPF0157 family)